MKFEPLNNLHYLIVSLQQLKYQIIPLKRNVI